MERSPEGVQQQQLEEEAATAPSSVHKRKTYFATPGYVYVPPNSDGTIPTQSFIAASRGIVEFIAMLGAAFSPVKNDVAGNVNKLETVYKGNPEKNRTIQALVISELSANNGNLGFASEGLLWLKRGLEFIRILLEFLIADHISGSKAENMVAIFREAYEKTLKRHHNFFSKKLFGIMIHASPWRRDLLRAIALGNKETSEDECIADLQKYMVSYCQNVDTLVKFYEDLRLETPNGLPEDGLKETSAHQK